MALAKLTTDLNIISALPDQPNQSAGLTAAQMKAKYDEGTNDIKNFINDTLTVEIGTLDSANVKKTGDQTIEGVKTFSSIPVGPSSAPTTDYQLANKKYVDDNSPVLQGSIHDAFLGNDATDIKSRFTSHLADYINTVTWVSVKAKLFGAYGDGVHDDTTAIQNAIDYAAAHGIGIVFIPAGTYLVSSSITVTASNLIIIGEGEKTILTAGTNNALDGILVVTGSIGTQTVITTNLNRYTTTLPITPATEFIIISTDEKYSTEQTYYKKGEFLNVNGSTVIDEIMDSYSFTGNNLTIQEITPIQNVYVRDITFTKTFNSGTTNTTTGLKFVLAYNCGAENIHCSNFDSASIQLDRCYNCHVIKSYCENANTASGTAYGISIINSSRKIYISTCKGYKLRHYVAIGCNGLGMPRYIFIENCRDTHTNSASYDIHGIAEYVHYKNCIGEEFSCGGQYNIFEGCKITASKASIATYKGWIWSIRKMSSGCQFINCDFKKVRGWDNQNIFGTDFISNYTVRGCKIEFYDNKADGTFLSGSYWYNVQMFIYDNYFYSSVAPVLDGSSYETVKDDIMLVVGANSIIANNVFNNLVDPIRVYADNVTIKNNKFLECFNYTIQALTNASQTNIKNLVIHGNEFYTTNALKEGAGRYVIRLYSNIAGNIFENLKITDNIIRSAQQNTGGILLFGAGVNSATKNSKILIANNQILNMAGTGIEIQADYEKVLLANNIVLNNSTNLVLTATDVVQDNNIAA
jgi:hypothetical protein